MVTVGSYTAGRDIRTDPKGSFELSLLLLSDGVGGVGWVWYGVHYSTLVCFALPTVRLFTLIIKYFHGVKRHQLYPPSQA